MEILWGEAAVVLDNGDLVIGDLHIGLEHNMRRSGYRIIPVYRQIIARILDLIDSYRPDRLVILGDLKDSIGNPTREEIYQIDSLIDSLDIPVLVVLGNHDGGLKEHLESKGIVVKSSSGFLDNSYYLFHGNAIPSSEAEEARMLLGCHWHPTIRLRDINDRVYSDRAWFIVPTSFGPNLLMIPAFNNLVGGATPDEIDEKYLDMSLAEIYLMDGTFLGVWGQIRNRLK